MLDASYERSGLLLEIECGMLQVPGAQGRGQFRSLLPASERVSINGAVSRPLIDDVMFSLNGRFSNVRDDALAGLSSNGALNRDTDRRTGRLANIAQRTCWQMAMDVYRWI